MHGGSPSPTLPVEAGCRSKDNPAAIASRFFPPAGWDRQDLEQEAAIALWLGRPPFLTLIDVIRRATHHRTERGPVRFVTFTDDLPAGDITVDAVLVRDEIHRLPRLLLQRGFGYSLSEIAAANGLTYKAVESRLARQRVAARTRRHRCSCV